MSDLLFSLTNFKKKSAPAGKTVFQKEVFEQLKRGALQIEHFRNINKTNTQLDL